MERERMDFHPDNVGSHVDVTVKGKTVAGYLKSCGPDSAVIRFTKPLKLLESTMVGDEKRSVVGTYHELVVHFKDRLCDLRMDAS